MACLSLKGKSKNIFGALGKMVKGFKPFFKAFTNKKGYLRNGFGIVEKKMQHTSLKTNE